MTKTRKYNKKQREYNKQIYKEKFDEKFGSLNLLLKLK